MDMAGYLVVVLCSLSFGFGLGYYWKNVFQDSNQKETS